MLRAENEKLQCENAAMLEALKNVTCPLCGGPPFGREEREPNLHKLRLENPLFKAEVIIRFHFSKLFLKLDRPEPDLTMNLHN